MSTLSFADNLKFLLKSRNIRLDKIAGEIGITKQGISNYTTGKTFPKPEILIKIADFFGVSLDFLLTGKTQIQMASKLLKLSEKAIETIIALSPDDALALSDSFEFEYDDDIESEIPPSLYNDEWDENENLVFSEIIYKLAKLEDLLKELLDLRHDKEGNYTQKLEEMKFHNMAENDGGKS